MCVNKSKLIISLSDKKGVKSNGTVIESLNLDDISPYGLDEKQVAKVLGYTIKIEMRSGVIQTSDYITLVQGIVNTNTNKAYIENLTTEHVAGSGLCFLGKNHGLGTNNAYIVFAHADLAWLSFCRVDFKISNTGAISLAGTTANA